MYFAFVLQKRFSHLRWEQSKNNKRDANYGQPILVGFGRIALNPVHIIITAAYGMASGKRGPERVHELWDYWSNLAATNSN